MSILQESERLRNYIRDMSSTVETTQQAIINNENVRSNYNSNQYDGNEDYSSNRQINSNRINEDAFDIWYEEA